jgi:hypothetical protein
MKVSAPSRQDHDRTVQTGFPGAYRRASRLKPWADIYDMKLLIAGLLIAVVVLVYLAPDVKESRADAQRAADQYHQRLK